jgi:peptide/nickel transport system permease protein
VLGLSALALATSGGFAIDVLAGARPGGPVDAAVRALASVVNAAPVFWTGQLLIVVVAVKLRMLPAGGMTSARDDLHGVRYAVDVGRHLILPAVTLALPVHSGWSPG